jgi:hypothetical protein
MLAHHEVFKRIKPVDIAPVLRVIDRLEFADSGGKCAWVTKPGSVAPPELTELLQGLQIGGQARRVFCRKLMPGQGIAAHVDDYEAEWKTGGPLRRFHVPLVSHPAVRMRWPAVGIEQYLEPGWLWEVRFDRLHEVVHEADVPRIHLQIDQVNATI